MAVVEAFARLYGTSVAAQFRPIAGITTLVVIDFRMTHANTGPVRIGELLLEIDGDPYTVEFKFADEALDSRTLQGHEKQKTPAARER